MKRKAVGVAVAAVELIEAEVSHDIIGEVIMRNIKTVMLATVLVLFGLSVAWAEEAWEVGRVGDLNIALWRQSDSTSLMVYRIYSGSVWIGVNLPQDSAALDRSHPVTMRIDRGKAFTASLSGLLTHKTGAAWELMTPGATIAPGSLLDRLMKGNHAEVRCTDSSGRDVHLKIPLKGSGSSIRQVLAAPY